MRSIILTYFIFILPFVANAQGGKSMSLDECINYALANNEQLESARLDNQIAKTQIDETLSRGLPQVNGSLTIIKNFDIQTSFIQDFISPAVYGVLLDEGLLGGGTEIPEPQTFPAAFGTNYSGQAGFTARQLLFDGSFFVGLKAARTVKELSQKEQRQTEVQVVEQVSKAYYMVLIAQENLEYLGRDFQTLDTLLRETKLMFENGFAEKLDVARLQIQHNNLKTNLKNSAELLITSLNLLKFQMGMPVGERISLSGSLEEAEITLLEEGIEQGESAYLNRPEYDVLKTNKDLIELNIKNFQSQYLPNLYANFNLGWTAGTNTFSRLTELNDETWFRYSSVGVTLSVPIFDGLYKRSNVQRNKIQMQQVQLSLDQFQNNVSREVAEAQVKAENARRSIETQKENVELAREVYDITTIKYQEGVGSNIEVIEANNSLEQANTNYLNALYDAITAQIELKKALGTLYNQ